MTVTAAPRRNPVDRAGQNNLPAPAPGCGQLLSAIFWCCVDDGPPDPAGHEWVFMGRWVNLVFYSYVEECRAVNRQPFLYEIGDGTGANAPPVGQPDHEVHKCFVAAALNTRDRLVQETGTLVSEGCSSSRCRAVPCCAMPCP